jgi:two-component system, OmpR family, copper resistance phosphate regulon response regulator CusR
MKILLAEDDEPTADALRAGMAEQGLVVDVTGHGDEALYLAQTISYSLIILDVRLPGRDGWSILETYRRGGGQAPVLFLTAHDAVQDRVKGLELGADEYLVKPFAFSELLARVRSLLRRHGAANPELLRFEDLTLHVRRQQVTRGGVPIHLTPKEVLLLGLLLEHQGNVLSRTLIAERVWDMVLERDSNVVDVHVRRLRAKVDDPFERKLIHTVRGLGYVLR